MDNAEHPRGLRLLFVCTGNTCRSPMAAAIARAEAESRGWDVEVRSAGVGAMNGAPASGGAVRAAARNGLDLSGHVSTYLDADLASWADLILVMSVTHLVRVAELGSGEHASLLTAFATGGVTDQAIPDPIGGPDEEYLATFERLEELIGQAFERLSAEVTP